MNTQRWLALGFVIGIAAIIATRPLWLQAAQGSNTEDTSPTASPFPTPAPFVTSTLSDTEETGTVQSTPVVLATAETGQTMEEGAMMEGNEMVDTSSVPEGSTAPFILAHGDFVQLDPVHGGEGIATIYQDPDGRLFLRLEPFSVADAPDLRAALSSHAAPRTQNDLTAASGFLDLGPLQSNEGPQIFDLPVTIRLEQFQSVVVYDRRFNIILTTATLERQSAEGN